MFRPHPDNFRPAPLLGGHFEDRGDVIGPAGPLPGYSFERTLHNSSGNRRGEREQCGGIQPRHAGVIDSQEMNRRGRRLAIKRCFVVSRQIGKTSQPTAH